MLLSRNKFSPENICTTYQMAVWNKYHAGHITDHSHSPSTENYEEMELCPYYA
jgi:hypothetical protein